MENMVEIIRKIVENELRKLRIAELGVVTSIFPHSSESDKDNYECNVKLKYQDFELRKVPVATQHIGLANTPNVGDLVLVTFLDGDINAPVVVGRLYNDEDRPPVTKEEEIVYKPPYTKGSGLRRFHLEFPGGIVLSLTDDEISAKAGKTTLTLNRDGDVAIKSAAKVTLNATGGMSITADTLELKDTSGNKVTIDSKQNAINLESALQLKLKANMVEIEGTASLSLKSNAILTIQGMPVKIN